MSCSRCHGLMVRDRYNVLEVHDRKEMWRCLNCGDVVDQQILAYRSTRTLHVAEYPRSIVPGKLPSLAQLLAGD